MSAKYPNTRLWDPFRRRYKDAYGIIHSTWVYQHTPFLSCTERTVGFLRKRTIIKPVTCLQCLST